MRYFLTCMASLARLKLSTNRLFTVSWAFVFVVVLANKRKTGGLNCSETITSGSRRGKHSTSVLVPQNPSSSVVASQSQNAHKIQLGPLCPASSNPPPCHPYSSTIQAHPPNVPFQTGPPPFSSIQPSAGTWHSGMSPHPYYLVALPTNVRKCYGCREVFAKKYRQPPYNIVVKHLDRRMVGKVGNTGTPVYNTDFTNTYYHPNPLHIKRKNPVFDDHVRIDSLTYRSLDERQREILKKNGLIVDIDNSR